MQNPNAYNSNLIDPTFSRPYGPWGGISRAHPLGVEPVTGRDMLSRVVNGARVSLIIAFLSTALAVGIGVVMGVIAGYFGGWVDAVIARAMDIFLAFPLLVFAPGFLQCSGAYSDLLRAWTSAGYVVAAVNFPRTNCHLGAEAYEADLVNQPQDMSYVLTRLLALSAQPGDPWRPPAQVGLHHVGGPGQRERRTPGQALEQHARQRVDVRPPVRLAAVHEPPSRGDFGSELSASFTATRGIGTPTVSAAIWARIV